MRSASLKKGRDQHQKVRGEFEEKPGIKEAFKRLVCFEEGDIAVGDFTLAKKFLKRTVLKNYVDKRYPERIAEKVVGLVEFMGPLFNLRKFQDMSVHFTRSVRKLKRLAFQIFDLDGDGFICIKDVFQHINNPAIAEDVIYEDVLTVSKVLNQKRSNQDLLRRKSTLINYRDVHMMKEYQPKIYQFLKQEQRVPAESPSYHVFS